MDARHLAFVQRCRKYSSLPRNLLFYKITVLFRLMETTKRTHTCGELRGCDDGKTVVLNGWVHRIREHGGISFINLRDRYGITQVVVDSDSSAELLDTAKNLRMEFCIAVEGVVRARPDSMINKDK